ncbi:unknown [Prevotella sp. CAG:1185]|nr:unknown [Prevotella sp. CAG:1185]
MAQLIYINTKRTRRWHCSANNIWHIRKTFNSMPAFINFMSAMRLFMPYQSSSGI